MRGELCVGFASILSLASLLLMIFVHVGQINTSKVPRGIYFAKLNVTGYGDALQAAIPDPITNLYTTNASAPLGQSAGLRPLYEFGLYAHCGYVDAKNGTCGNHTIGDQFKPFDAMISDMPDNYRRITVNLLPTNITIRDTKYLGQSSKAAYWMLLLGTIAAAIAFVTSVNFFPPFPNYTNGATFFSCSGIAKNNLTFFVSSIFAIAGSVLLLIGAAIWTVLVNKTATLNNLLLDVQPGGTVPLGIEISAGPGLFMTWAAFACLIVSIIPYMISCCTYRG